MKIELKHLAPYLPYELKSYASYDGKHFMNEVTPENVDSIINGESLHRPMLRPISNLSKEEITYCMDLYGLTEDEILNSPIENLPYGLISSWIEGHIDVFRLTDHNLAMPFKIS